MSFKTSFNIQPLSDAQVSSNIDHYLLHVLVTITAQASVEAAEYNVDLYCCLGVCFPKEITKWLRKNMVYSVFRYGHICSDKLN